MSRRHARWWLLVTAIAVLVVSGCQVAPAGAPGAGTTGSSGATAVSGSGGPTTPASFDPKRIDPLPASEPRLPVTVTGADGRSVTVTDAGRIVAVNLSGSVAELVVTLGLGDRLVGRDIAATFHGTEDVPVVTKGHDLAAEPILALNPTVVLVDASIGPARVLDQLRAAGVPVVMVPEAWSIAEIEPRITAVATALGVPEAGAALVGRTHRQLEQVLATVGDHQPKPRVAFLYLRGTAGVYLLAGKGSGADSMIEAIGAQDAGTAIGISKFRPLTSEGLIQAAPDVILTMTDGLESVGGIDGLLKVPGLAQTPAGRDRRIVTMDDGALLSFGPRTPELVQVLAEKVYQR